MDSSAYLSLKLTSSMHLDKQACGHNPPSANNFFMLHEDLDLCKSMSTLITLSENATTVNLVSLCRFATLSIPASITP